MAVADTTNLKAAKPAKLAPSKSGIAYNQVDNSYRLTTPENISFEYQLAGPFRRVLPYLLDIFIVIVGYAALVFVIWLLVALVGALFALVGIYDVAEFIFAMLLALIPIGWFVTYWFYSAYAETYYNGRTFGKLVANIRVLSADGHAIDGAQAMLRNLFRLIDLMPLISIGALFEISEIPPQIGLPTGIFGLIAMSISPRYQRLGDFVAGTMVVTEDTSQDPHVQTFADSRVPQLAEVIPSSFYVSNSLGKAVAAYAERREQLGIARSGEIAAKLAGTLCEEFGLPADTDPDLLICSLYYKIFVGEAPEEPLRSQSPYSSSPYSESPYPPAPPLNRYDPAPQHSPLVDPFSNDADGPTDPTLPVAPQINPSADSELE